MWDVGMDALCHGRPYHGTASSSNDGAGDVDCDSPRVRTKRLELKAVLSIPLNLNLLQLYGTPYRGIERKIHRCECACTVCLLNNINNYKTIIKFLSTLVHRMRCSQFYLTPLLVYSCS